MDGGTGVVLCCVVLCCLMLCWSVVIGRISMMMALMREGGSEWVSG